MASRYVTSTADTSRSEPARLDSIAYGPGETWPVDPRYRLMRLCECEACEGRGKLRIAQGEFARCPDCRGEGKTLDEVARCDTPAAIGTALVTLATEGEFDGCPFGLIDDQGEPGLKWLVRPWVASPRNVSDAARTLAKSKGDKT